MTRQPPRATQSRSSAASDVYKRQVYEYDDNIDDDDDDIDYEYEEEDWEEK